ncbi:heavy metal translocating P-type ATPase [Gallaecimonas kandeliae]|uniref:heavy metal translocating P-type ATPase n=1 Tax=Gallaecimonas kandeliae TaxID=3029055 RepID=UPI0026480D9E|nr:heavy metal translocating P-type ATPase [Gallaecimonas kandeliae]WKE66346.1 heavy metal translocating P-type ATPase [Gallaecimonas kandeliae]
MSQAVHLALLGVSCAGCVRSIEKALGTVEGVEKASVNLADRSAHIEGSAEPQAMIEAIQAAGYDARLLSGDDESDLDTQQAAENAHLKKLWWQSAAGLALGVPLMAWGLLGGEMMVTTPGSRLAWAAVALLCLAVMVLAGGHFYRGAAKALGHHQANMDSLIALGTGAAWLYSVAVLAFPALFPANARHLYFEAGVMIIGLINLGQALEVRARGKTSLALRRLLDLKPKTARVLRKGKEWDIPAAAVLLDDQIRVRPGETLAVDGKVLEGTGLVDESMLTGEPVPVAKAEGDKLHAGTLLQQGSLIFEATGVGKDTALARIIAQVKKAQGSKPPIGRLADNIAAVFVPAVMVVALVAALVWYNLGPAPAVSHMLVVATSVLIIACPCALGLATPISIMVGVGKAAEAGVLIRSGSALQKLCEVDTLVLDKTGTLTQGKPKVVDAKLLLEGEIKAWVKALEQGSEHPLAAALLDWAGSSAPAPITGFDTLAGHGVKAMLDGEPLLLGNQRLMAEQGIDLAAVETDSEALMAKGATPVYLAKGGQLAALFALADPLKPDSAAAVAALKKQGLRLVLLSGDRQQTVQALADELGIAEVIAEVLPEQKAEVIRRLQSQGRQVAMVGDGINDAPALAAADVGLAMGGGTDVAMEAADLTLMRGSLAVVEDAMALSRATIANIKQNLAGAFLYNSLGIPVAAGVLYPFTGWLLSPIIAGLAMALSSVTVVSNANRLRFFKPGGKA